MRQVEFERQDTKKRKLYREKNPRNMHNRPLESVDKCYICTGQSTKSGREQLLGAGNLVETSEMAWGW